MTIVDLKEGKMNVDNQCSNYTVGFGGAHFFLNIYIYITGGGGGGGGRALTMTYKDT